MNTVRLLGIAAVCVLAGSSAWGRDLKTVRGTVYKNITVTNKDATGLEISYDDGVAFIDFSHLGKADQAEFGFDPTAYAAGLKQKAVAEVIRREQALLAKQAAAARAASQAAQKNAWKTYSMTGPQPPYVPTNQTGVEFYYDTPGFNYGGGYYTYPNRGGYYPPSTGNSTYRFGASYNVRSGGR